ncbi:TonB family protein [Sphingosinicellaceae bacterium]|nr:TonB family protein [Sphingosinicellaceae bacterium]
MFRSIPTTQIPDTPPPRTNAEVPKTIFDKVVVSVPEPVINQFDTPKADDTVPLTLDPTGGVDGDIIAGLSGGTVEIVKPPAGITRSAAIDPRYRADFEAPYPPASQRLGEAGTVVVRVVVGIDGRVVRASIAQSSGFPRLDDAALKRALAKWRFVPALRDGAPVEAEREVPVTFRLLQG